MSNIAQLNLSYNIKHVHRDLLCKWQGLTMQMTVQLTNNSTIGTINMPTISGGQTRNLQSLSQTGYKPNPQMMKTYRESQYKQ